MDDYQLYIIIIIIISFARHAAGVVLVAPSIGTVVSHASSVSRDSSQHQSPLDEPRYIQHIQRFLHIFTLINSSVLMVE